MKILILVLALVIAGCQSNANLSAFDELQRLASAREHEAMELAERGVTIQCATGKIIVYPNGTTEIQIKIDCSRRGRLR